MEGNASAVAFVAAPFHGGALAVALAFVRQNYPGHKRDTHTAPNQHSFSTPQNPIYSAGLTSQSIGLTCAIHVSTSTQGLCAQHS